MTNAPQTKAPIMIAQVYKYRTGINKSKTQLHWFEYQCMVLKILNLKIMSSTKNANRQETN